MDDKAVAEKPVAEETVGSKLMGLGVSPEHITQIQDKLGAESLEDLVNLTVEDLTSVGVKPLQARKVVKALAPTKPIAEAPTIPSFSLDVLPSIPDDKAWLEALRVGGVLKFNRDTVVGTVSAALANQVGLFELPKRLIAAMEKNAESLEEPVGEEFYTMQRMLTEHSYSEVFAALPGATGRYATATRKAALLQKMDDNLWRELFSFQGQLVNWMDSWQKGAANPALLLSALASLSGGNGAAPGGLMQAPPTDTLRGAAESLITSINGIFAGTGIPVAMALAYDAQQIRKALEDPSLPAQVGALNREQMLKSLGVAVSSDYPRLEANLKRYTVSVIELPNVTAGQPEWTYVTALYQLGASIPWDKLGAGAVGAKVTGLGGKPRWAL